jgi:preprotein translocase subunit SecG
METAILVLHVLVAIAMTAFILLQQGKGAEMGASFGAGASQTVFGAAGATSLLTRITAVLAAIFFVTSLSLAIYARKNAESYGVLPEAQVEESSVTTKPVGDVPAAPAATAPVAGDVPAAPAK